MYVISRSANLTLPIRGGKVDYHPTTGAILRVHRALSVQFQFAGTVPPYAREAVSRLANWGNGMAENEDPFTRCGSLDTEVEAQRQGWDDEELATVEEALRNASSNGVEYVIASEPVAAKPWDKYDEFVGEDAVAKILYTIDLIGADPKKVIRYEKENLDRADVVDALEALVEKDADDVVGVISV